jgi:hypothetical protein
LESIILSVLIGGVSLVWVALLLFILNNGD